MHAEAAIKALSLPELPRLQDICVVPVYDEPLEALLACLAHPFICETALIWVFNCPENAPELAVKRTQSCLSHLREKADFHDMGGGLLSARAGTHLNVLVLDFTNSANAIPAKQGVGLARKLGLDLAIRLCERQLAGGEATPHWLHNCDADVSWPTGYMQIPAPQPGQVVSLYPFRHQPEPGWQQAMALYDLRLQYYVALLNRAGSPYAFQTLGSAIAVTPQAYIQVHGMPKRSGGEDFYFLNKLAKLGVINSLEQPELTIAGRPSERVPFGTGPALKDIRQLADPLADYQLYHPLGFERLRLLLSAVRSYHAQNGDFLSFLANNCGAHAEVIENVVCQLGVQRFLSHLARQTHQRPFPQLFHIWFDGFQTLKFIHTMRALDCPDLCLHEISAYKNLLAPGLLDSIDSLL